MSGAAGKGAAPGEGDTSLEKVQRWFQSVISHPDGVAAGAAATPEGEESLDGMLTRSEALDAASRLSVYADAYFARLIECMGEVFPMMRKFLGEEVFDTFAFDYLKDSPSRSYTLHHLGRHFPAWLETSRSRAEEEAGVAPASEGPDWPELLVDLARMEWAVYDTFDGPGLEGQATLTAASLGRIPPEAWDHVRLEPAPSLKILELRFPVNGFYSALRHAAEDEEVVPPEPCPSWLALNRRDYIVRRHDLTLSSYTLLQAVLEGRSLGQAIDAGAALWTGSDEDLGTALQNWFRDWAESEFFAGFSQEGP